MEKPIRPKTKRKSTKDLSVRIGENLFYLRKIKHKISQEDLEYLSGVPQTTISGIERGQHDIATTMLRDLLVAMGETLEGFFVESSMKAAEAEYKKWMADPKNKRKHRAS